MCRQLAFGQTRPCAGPPGSHPCPRAGFLPARAVVPSPRDAHSSAGAKAAFPPCRSFAASGDGVPGLPGQAGAGWNLEWHVGSGRRKPGLCPGHCPPGCEAASRSLPLLSPLTDLLSVLRSQMRHFERALASCLQLSKSLGRPQSSPQGCRGLGRKRGAAEPPRCGSSRAPGPRLTGPGLP